MPAYKPGDRIRVSRDHRGRFRINKGTQDVGELRLMTRSPPRLTIGERRCVVRPFDDEWRLEDEETGETLATLRKRTLTVDGADFTLRRRRFAKAAILTDAEGRTLLRFTRVQETPRRRALVAHVEELDSAADPTLLFAFAAATVVLKGTFRPPKQRDEQGQRVGAWARGGQWGYTAAFYGGFAAVGDLSDSGGGLFGGGDGGGGFGDFGGGGDGGGGGGGDGGGGN